ncbi:MAG: NPCBM/NEW2 domain-containing protein [Anaerolineae bacterium]|nr:NPCBM/NEW2 domain-containing protein [Phycisphaerae bacterium]
MKRIQALALVVAVLFCSVARAVEPPDLWTLTTSDFKNERVRLRDFTERGVDVAPIAGGDVRHVARDQFLELQRGISVAPSNPGRFIAHLIDGDRFSGDPVGTAGETVNWNSRALGEIKLSMRNLHAIARADAAVDLSTTVPRGEDVILLSNGDSVRGVIASISASAASVQPSTGGDATNVPLDSISAMLFASTAAPATNPAAVNQSASFRVTLADGTALSVSNPSVQDGALKLDSRTGAVASVPLATVVSIEQINGPVIWLSSLAPSENVQTPYLDLSWPARMNATVSGDPIRANGRIIAHGIGVHSYSRISWPIDPSVLAFRTQYTIDGDQPYGDVTVRIKLDGKLVHELPSLRAGVTSPVIAIETNRARTITLEVDYGANADVQDRVNWIEPALLRYKPVPSTQPTTQKTE